MTKLLTAGLIAVSFATFAAPASARTDKTMSLKTHGHMMKVHVMTMDDGTMMVGLSQSQFEMLAHQHYPQLMNH